MGRKCGACQHDERLRIEYALAARVSVAKIAAWSKLHPDVIYRHRRNHMSKVALMTGLDAARQDNPLSQEAIRKDTTESFLSHLCAQRSDLHRLIDVAVDSGDHAAASRYYTNLTRVMEMLGKSVGELNAVSLHVQHNYIVSPEHVMFRAGLIQLTQQHPGIRRDVLALCAKVDGMGENPLPIIEGEVVDASP